MSQSDTFGLTDADRRKLADMAANGTRSAADPGRSTPPPEPTTQPLSTDGLTARNVPARHRAFAEELAFRDDVHSAAATPEGVSVTPTLRSRLPVWLYEKADVVGIELTVRGDEPDIPTVHALRRRREDAGLTLAAVAAEIGVDKSTYGKLENGQKGLRPLRAVEIGRAIEAATDGGSE